MKMPSLDIVSFAMVLGLALPSIATAGEAEFGVDAELGYRYDSNVGVAELDTNTGEADSALTIDVGGSAAIPMTDRLSLTLGGGYSQTRHRAFSAFDLGMLRADAELAFRIGGFRTGLALRHFGARLDGSRFLDLRQVSPSVARLFGDSLYLRAAYTAAEKTYAEHPERDAVNDAIAADAYLLFDGMEHYLSFGLEADAEDAPDAAFDYEGRRAKATWGRRLAGFPVPVDLKARLQREVRDYSGVTESIGAPRRDERFGASLAVELPVSELFSVNAEAEYRDVRSNLDTAAYAETVLSVSLAAGF